MKRDIIVMLLLLIHKKPNKFFNLNWFFQPPPPMLGSQTAPPANTPRGLGTQVMFVSIDDIATFCNSSVVCTLRPRKYL